MLLWRLSSQFVPNAPRTHDDFEQREKKLDNFTISKIDVKFVTRCQLLVFFHVDNLFYYFWLDFSQRLVAC